MIHQIDSIYKGDITTAHSALTATTTSPFIKTKGYNAILVNTIITGTGTWKIDVMGCNTKQGTYVDIYDNYDNQLTTGNLTASRMRLFVAIPDNIKIKATEVDGTATCTVEVQPIHI